MRGSIDFETFEWTNPLCAAITFGPKGERKTVFLHDETHEQGQALALETLQVMARATERYGVESWWAHNGGKYDWLFLVEAAIEAEWKITGHTTGDGRAISLTFQEFADSPKVVCHDSFALIQAKLSKIVEDFHIDAGKLFEGADYKDDMRRVPLERLKAGCIRDSEIVLDALDIVEGFAETAGGTLRATFSSTALSIVKATLSEDGIELPSHEGDQKINHICKQSYFGGRVEVFHHWPEAFLTEWDVNSSYPWSMCQPLPWELLGLCQSHQQVLNVLRGYNSRGPLEGCIRAKVTVPKEWMHIPPLPFRPSEKDGMFFPVGEWTGWFAAPELRYAITQGVKVEALDAVAYTQAQPFGPFVREAYAEKCRAEGARKAFFKLLLNGCYGKFCESDEKSVLKVFRTEEEAIEAATPPPGQEWKRGGVPLSPTNLRIMDMPFRRMPKQTHFALASYITAYSRILLHKALVRSSRLAYCDTDSVHAGTESALRMEPFAGSELGQLKVEAGKLRACYFAPKTYALEVEEDKGPKLHLASKGVPIPKERIAEFKRLVMGEEISLGRMATVRAQLAGEDARVQRLEFGRRWLGHSIKRFPYADGRTRPWTVEELVDGAHIDTRSPLYKHIDRWLESAIQRTHDEQPIPKVYPALDCHPHCQAA